MAKSLAVLAVLVHVAAAAHAPQRMQNRMANMAKQESPLFPQEASPIVLQEAKREMNNIATVGGGGDELSERGSSPRRASFGDVLNGRFQNDRLQHIADNFRLPTAPIVLPGANTPKPIHPEVMPGPNACCGDGNWDAVVGSCACKTGYYGPRCQFQRLNKHAHGRYVCPKTCPRGVQELPNGKCACPAGWSGQHCQVPLCLHGRLGCPTGGKFCFKPQCLCTPGWEGPRCGKKPLPRLPKPSLMQKIPALRHGKNFGAAGLSTKKPETPCNGHDLPCQNTGSFDWTTCKCKCLPPYTGEVCDKCLSMTCPKGKVQDPTTCGCICPASKTCANNGVLNDDTCGCNCTNAWHGDTCNKCTPKSCNGHGVWDMKQCACLCDAPWLPDTHCKACGSMECGKNGVFQEKSCKCQCKGNWQGVQCDECPTKEERIVAGIDCGLHGWDEEKCQCKETCEAQTCQHGGVQDPTTCTCQCNPDGNGTALATSGDVAKVAKATFWSGDVCEVCEEPEKSPCPGARKFNLTKCGCEESCPNVKCENGGVLNNGTCTCDCPPGWGGKMCADLADGSTKILASVSCKAAQAVRPAAAKTGLYWLNPTGTNPEQNSFQAVCDMSEDGGGWIEYASIGNALKRGDLHKDKYLKGYNSNVAKLGTEHIFPCNAFDGLDGGEGDLQNVVMRVTMGKVRDYFKPITGKSLCEMLTSQNNHMWSANGGVPTKDGGGGAWLKPTYNSDPNLKELLGGSNATYPKEIDGRQFLSFWGGDHGGCCHKYSIIYPNADGGADGPSWGNEFQIHIQEIVEAGKPVVDAAASVKAKQGGGNKNPTTFLEVDEDEAKKGRIARALSFLQSLRR